MSSQAEVLSGDLQSRCSSQLLPTFAHLMQPAANLPPGLTQSRASMQPTLPVSQVRVVCVSGTSWDDLENHFAIHIAWLGPSACWEQASETDDMASSLHKEWECWTNRNNHKVTFAPKNVVWIVPTCALHPVGTPWVCHVYSEFYEHQTQFWRNSCCT